MHCIFIFLFPLFLSFIFSFFHISILIFKSYILIHIFLFLSRFLFYIYLSSCFSSSSLPLSSSSYFSLTKTGCILSFFFLLLFPLFLHLYFPTSSRHINSFIFFYLHHLYSGGLIPLSLCLKATCGQEPGI